MYPSQSSSLQLTSVSALLTHYALPVAVWEAFTNVVGDPGEDIKLVAVLPPRVVGAGLAAARLQDGSVLSAVQASHVGLVYNLAKRIVHVKGGGDWDSWTEVSPFADASTPSASTPATAPAAPIVEKKVKMASIIDQQDETEVIVDGEDTKAGWYQQYLQTVGGWPPEEEEPTPEQVSSLAKRVRAQGVAPYVDFAIFTPYGHRTQRSAKFRTYILTAGGYTTKELPGPSNFTQWRTCYRVLRTTLIMLDCVSLSAMHNYEMVIERLARTYHNAWHLIYAADDMARSSHSNRLKAKINLDLKAGRPAPLGWDASRPWDYIFQALALDESFWSQQVHSPALVWLAAGARGSPRTPAEQLALENMQGGLAAISPALDKNVAQSSTTKEADKISPTKVRRDARKKKAKADREELSRFREDKKTGKAPTTSKQLCYGWNNGNGPCSGLPPGQACVSPVKRDHKCTKCKSPGHPSKDCPSK